MAMNNKVGQVMAMNNLVKKALKKALKKVNAYLVLSRYAASADAILVSFPKSGRTWFRFILSKYYVCSTKAGFKVDLHTTFEILPNFDLDPVRGLPAFEHRKWAGIPLIPVSHLPYRRLLFRRSPVIFMVRDPRDVMVSAYFHATRQKHRFEGDLTSFVRDPNQGIMSLIAYLNGWARGLRQRRHFVLSYERLSAEPELATAEVLQFLKCEVVPDALQEAVAHSRFEAMRELEVAQGIPSHTYNRTDTESLRMRRGKVAGYRDYLSKQDIDFIEGHCKSDLTPDAKNLIAATGFEIAAT